MSTALFLCARTAAPVDMATPYFQGGRHQIFVEIYFFLHKFKWRITGDPQMYVRCFKFGNFGTSINFFLTLYVPIIAILDIWKTTRVDEGESVVYDGFKYVWPVKG